MTQKHPLLSFIHIKAFASPATRRSSGQGLLLAVLVMLLVALLGATFVGVISFNLSQAARHEDTVRAEAMARGGIQYADEQLTNSMEGPSWRPSDHFGGGSAAAARSTDASYYDEIEKARGWNDGYYVKYPDPYDPNTASISNPDFGGGRFLLKVEYPGGAAGSDTEKFIKITSIGRSSNNPAVFKERVAYKPVSLVDNLLFVTHKKEADGTPDTTQTAVLGTAPQLNFDAETLLQAATAVSATSINVRNKGGFAAGDTILVGDGVDRETATIQTTPDGVDNGTDNQIDLTAGLAKAHPIDAPVQRSATDVPLSDVVKTIFDGSIFINGNLRWFGNTTVNLTSSRKDTVQIAGLIDSDPSANTKDIRVSVDGADLASTTGNDIESSTTFNNITSGGDSVYKDARGRVTNDRTLSDRWVRPTKAPVFVTGDVSSGNVKWIHYADLTRYSDNALLSGSSNKTRGETGFGNGIYVDNSTDIQYSTSLSDRINATSPSAAKLVQDWQDTTGTDKDGDASHGWVNHLEYVPPGVEIVIRNDDVEADTTPTSLGTKTQHTRNKAPHINGRPVLWLRRSSVDTNSWYRRDNGNALSDKWVSFDYPSNGVILAEGNIRIRGNLAKSTATNRYDLTVISGGTIYVEGNILTPKDWDSATPSANNTHIALLAKDHLCVNTTQFHHRGIDGLNEGPTGDSAPKNSGSDDNVGNDSRWILSDKNNDDLEREVTFGPYNVTPDSTYLTVRYGGVLRVNYMGSGTAAALNITGSGSNRLMSPTVTGGTSGENFGTLDLKSKTAPDDVEKLDNPPSSLKSWLSDPLREGWDAPSIITGAGTLDSRELAKLGGASGIDLRFFPFWLPLNTDLTIRVDEGDTTPANLLNTSLSDSFSDRRLTYPFTATPIVGVPHTVLFDRENKDNAFRLTRLKFEQVKGSRLQEGMDITISALMYAQDGTFFVIPGVYFDDSTKTATDGSDGSIRLRRYNYHIKIKGAVAQNYTADEGATDPYSANMNSTLWTDKWSYPAWNGTRYDWTGIEYQYDPELRTSSGGTLVLPYLPVAEGLVFEG